MAGPDIGFLELLNNVLPYVGMVVVAIVAVVIFVWYTKKYTPEIARRFIKAYHSRGLPAFIQDEMGNVELHICDKKFPEGVVHIKNKGWFLLPNPPNPESEFKALAPLSNKRKPGRPPKNAAQSQGPELGSAENPEVIPPRAVVNLENMSDAEKQAYVMAHGILVQTPILRGFGKQVFFGSSVSVALSNLTAIANADLPAVRYLSPRMYQKTQLDALATGNRLEGLKMARGEATKFLLYVIIAIIPIAVTGLIVYLLTQHPAALLGVIV